MSPRHSQGISTWLIMIPLLVVPLIAVFGVPKFAPITAQTADGANGEESFLQLDLGSEAPLADTVPPFPGGTIESAPANPASSTEPESWADPFENPSGLLASLPQDGNSPRTPPAATASDAGFGDPFSRPSASAETTPPDEIWTQPNGNTLSPQPEVEGYSRRSSAGNASRTPPASNIDPAVQLTWRQAVARLNELGVQKFQLSQTEEPFVFQFVCDLSRPDNPKVTHRFEAKAGEPLKAVENVIQQVESWSAQQASR